MTDKKKILIGYDGSDCAEAAFDDLQKAGLPEVAQAVVMSVTEVWLPAPPPSSYEIVAQAGNIHIPADIPRVYYKDSPAAHETKTLAERGAARLRAIRPGWKVTVETSLGSPGKELIRKADDWQPDLIVVGSHGRSMLERLVLGSVSQTVLTYARNSVRVARGRIDEPNTPVRLVIGVDGSPASAAAVREVASRRWPALSEVRVIAVNDPLTPTIVGSLIPPVGKMVDECNQADLCWLKKILLNCSEELAPSGLKVSTETKGGDPKHELVKAAEAWGADCIFVGAVGFANPLERLALGSVSASVAARAHCSVEVVRPKRTDGSSHHKYSFDASQN